LEDRLQALVQAAALGLVHHQELVVGRLLNLDEVRHLCHFRNFTEEFPDASAAIESLCLGHRRSLATFSGQPRRGCLASPPLAPRPVQNGRKPVSGKPFPALWKEVSTQYPPVWGRRTALGRPPQPQ